jgi:LuxR family transcriptional regulator, quorum-sensing system regulator SolR
MICAAGIRTQTDINFAQAIFVNFYFIQQLISMIYSTDTQKLKNHLMQTSSPAVAAIMLPQLSKHGIKVFHFNRHYEDGSFIRLSTDPKWNEHYFAKGYINKRKKVPVEYLVNPINYFVWLTKDWPEMLTDAAVNFDIANGISIVEKCDGYIDNFCFGSTVNNTSIVNFYMNNLDLLQRCGFDFRDKASALLTTFEKDKIIIPEMKTAAVHSNCSNIETPGLNLTTRERDCAVQLMMGKRIKEIARQLNLSPRTVESYVNNMKTKLDCRDKMELTIKLREIFTY